MGMLPPTEAEKAWRTLDKMRALRKEAEVLEAVAHANSSKISFNGQKVCSKDSFTYIYNRVYARVVF
jgi:hypothetical protein